MTSGQVINRDKSSILFSPNTRDDVRLAMTQRLCILVEARNERFLGLPVSIGKYRKKAFEYLKKKVWLRIQGWEEFFFVKGRERDSNKGGGSVHPHLCDVLFRLNQGSV